MTPTADSPQTAQLGNLGTMDARVVDYLDDKLQTLGDLDSLDVLLSNIHTQQGLLKQQVRPSISVLPALSAS